ncbi:MAG: hypothetical protein JXR95_11665, partial [Deltaproteobacteria bacterium]|nr:hypothetical protein [Deltaproteobacteria bacterium]
GEEIQESGKEKINLGENKVSGLTSIEGEELPEAGESKLNLGDELISDLDSNNDYSGDIEAKSTISRFESFLDSEFGVSASFLDVHKSKSDTRLVENQSQEKMEKSIVSSEMGNENNDNDSKDLLGDTENVTALKNESVVGLINDNFPETGLWGVSNDDLKKLNNSSENKIKIETLGRNGIFSKNDMITPRNSSGAWIPLDHFNEGFNDSLSEDIKTQNINTVENYHNKLDANLKFNNNAAPTLDVSELKQFTDNERSPEGSNEIFKPEIMLVASLETQENYRNDKVTFTDESLFKDSITSLKSTIIDQQIDYTTDIESKFKPQDLQTDISGVNESDFFESDKKSSETVKIRTQEKLADSKSSETLLNKEIYETYYEKSIPDNNISSSELNSGLYDLYSEKRGNEYKNIEMEQKISNYRHLVDEIDVVSYEDNTMIKRENSGIDSISESDKSSFLNHEMSSSRRNELIGKIIKRARASRDGSLIKVKFKGTEITVKESEEGIRVLVSGEDSSFLNSIKNDLVEIEKSLEEQGYNLLSFDFEEKDKDSSSEGKKPEDKDGIKNLEKKQSDDHKNSKPEGSGTKTAKGILDYMA